MWRDLSVSLYIYIINVEKDFVKASPFKLPPTIPEKDEERKIIEQNNYTNKCLNVIGDQLDKIENKIDSINIKQTPNKIETPLVKTQELKTGLSHIYIYIQGIRVKCCVHIDKYVFIVVKIKCVNLGRISDICDKVNFTTKLHTF